MTMKSDLSQMRDIAKKYQTDKFKNENYLKVYSKHFKDIRKSATNVLEIGVKRDPQGGTNGARSLKLWKEYFESAEVHGIDIDPENKKYEESRIQIHIGNQGDPYFLKETVALICTNQKSKNPTPESSNEQDIKNTDAIFDAIIDDGSHINVLTLTSFTHLWPHVKKGGVYIIEDLGCSYIDLEQQNIRSRAATQDAGWEGMHLAPKEISYKNERSVMDKFFLDRIKILDFMKVRSSLRAEAGVFSYEDIESLHFTEGMCTISKMP